METERKVLYVQEPEPKLIPLREVMATFCYRCGATHREGQNFCARCGADVKILLGALEAIPTVVTSSVPVVEAPPATTSVAEATPVEKAVPVEESAPAVACPMPRVEIPTPVVEAPPAVDVPRPRKRKYPFWVSLIRSSLVLALAIFLAVASFLPLLKTEVDLGIKEKAYVTFGTMDGISMLVNLCDEMDDDDLLDLIDEFGEEYADYYEEWQEGDELGEFSKFTKEIVKLYLRSEDAQVTPGAVLVAIFSIVQWILVLLLLVFAVLSFVGVFVKSVPKFPLLSMLLLGLSTVWLVLTAVAIDLSYGISVMVNKSVVTKLGAAPVLACIFFGVIAVLCFTLELTLNKRRVLFGEIVKRSLCVGFALLLLIGVFAPVVTTEIKTQFKKSSATKTVNASVDASVYALLTLSEQDIEQFENWDDNGQFEGQAQTLFDEFSLYTQREIEKGDAEYVNGSLYAYLLLGYGMYESSAVFGVATVITILVFLCALLILCQNLTEMATGLQMSNVLLLVAKIAAVIMALFLLVLAIVMVSTVNENALEAKVAYEVGLSCGTFLMLIGAVGALSTPGVNKMKQGQ